MDRRTIMGTKRDPGPYDCYANAEDDEPIFVLLGRDRHAPFLLEAWANMRQADGESPEKIAEARACAEAMRAFRAQRKKGA
jgi:hypothetical protein